MNPTLMFAAYVVIMIIFWVLYSKSKADPTASDTATLAYYIVAILFTAVVGFNILIAIGALAILYNNKYVNVLE